MKKNREPNKIVKAEIHIRENRDIKRVIFHLGQEYEGEKVTGFSIGPNIIEVVKEKTTLLFVGHAFTITSELPVPEQGEQQPEI